MARAAPVAGQEASGHEAPAGRRNPLARQSTLDRPPNRRAATSTRGRSGPAVGAGTGTADPVVLMFFLTQSSGFSSGEWTVSTSGGRERRWENWTRASDSSTTGGGNSSRHVRAGRRTFVTGAPHRTASTGSSSDSGDSHAPPLREDACNSLARKEEYDGIRVVADHRAVASQPGGRLTGAQTELPAIACDFSVVWAGRAWLGIQPGAPSSTLFRWASDAEAEPGRSKPRSSRQDDDAGRAAGKGVCGIRRSRSGR